MNERREGGKERGREGEREGRKEIGKEGPGRGEEKKSCPHEDYFQWRETGNEQNKEISYIVPEKVMPAKGTNKAEKELESTVG
jgi:hypothetical protein